MARGYSEPVSNEYGSDDNNRDRWRENERERSTWRDRDDDRGLFERAGDEIRSWFGDDDDRQPRDAYDRGYSRPKEPSWNRDRDFSRGGVPRGGSSWDRERERDFGRESRSSFGGMAQGGMSQSGYGRSSGGFGRERDRFGPPSRGSSRSGEYGSDFRSQSGRNDRSSWDRDRDLGDSRLGYGDFRGTLGGFGNQTFGSSQDDHYRSWRDIQLQQLDQDYDDYCREREQQFHSDFDSWRRNRPNTGQGASTTSPSGDLGASPNAGVGTTTASMSGTAGKGSAIGSGTTSGSSIQSDTTGSTETAGTGSSGRSRSRS